MSKKGIFYVSPKDVPMEKYSSVKDLAKEICDWVKESGVPATIQSFNCWWSKAVVSPFIGGASNWSIGYDKSFDISILIQEIQENGLFVSAVTDYPNWLRVDTEEYEYVSPTDCILPQYSSEKDLAKEICDWVKESGVTATIQTANCCWYKAMISPDEGKYTKASSSYNKTFDISILIQEILENGLVVTGVDNHPEWLRVAKVSFE